MTDTGGVSSTRHGGWRNRRGSHPAESAEGTRQQIRRDVDVLEGLELAREFAGGQPEEDGWRQVAVDGGAPLLGLGPGALDEADALRFRRRLQTLRLGEPRRTVAGVFRFP